MALKEMQAYQPGVNVDRIVSLAALIAFVKIQDSNRQTKVRIENEIPNNLENSQKLYKLKSRPFRNIGKQKTNSAYKKKRNPYKRLR